MDQNEQVQENQQIEQLATQPVQQYRIAIIGLLILISVAIGIVFLGQKRLTKVQMPSAKEQTRQEPTPTLTEISFNYEKRHYKSNQQLYPDGKLDYPAVLKNTSDDKLEAFDCHDVDYDTFQNEQVPIDDNTIVHLEDDTKTHFPFPAKKIVQNALTSLNLSGRIHATFCNTESNKIIYWLSKEMGTGEGQFDGTLVYFFVDGGPKVRTSLPVLFTQIFKGLQPLQLTTDGHFYLLSAFDGGRGGGDKASDYYVIYDVNIFDLSQAGNKIILQKDCNILASPVTCIDGGYVY